MKLKQLLLALGVTLLTGISHAQQGTMSDSVQGNVFTYVEQMPEFASGQAELMKFLQQNLRYPADARAKGIEGRVVAQFIVNEKGNISDITILRGIYPSCDSEVVRVISAMPRWNPGKQNGNAVKVYFKLPVTFKLNEQDLTKPGITLPSYPGGEDSLNVFIKKNLQYPKLAKKNKTEGMVTLSFNVDSVGKVRDITVYKSVGNGCDEEAIRILKLIPKWNTGTKDGQTVTMPYYMNVEFKLEGKK
jgi:TonB family protein